MVLNLYSLKTVKNKNKKNKNLKKWTMSSKYSILQNCIDLLCPLMGFTS